MHKSIPARKQIKAAIAILAVFLLASNAACSPDASKNVKTPVKPQSAEDLAMQKVKQAGIKRFRKSPMGNDTGMTIVSKVNRDGQYKTSYMIISKDGTVIVVDPYRIPPVIEADLIITTHGDDDHNDASFYKRSSAKRSLYTLEKFTYRNIAITGIPSSHQGDDFDPTHPSNVIYLLEVDGLRFAVMGDICQTKLNDAQLKALGRVDIAFMIMFDAPQFGFTRERSFAILTQMQPKLIFPTHTSRHLATSIGEAMGGVIMADYYYPIDASKLGNEPGKVVLLANLPD